MNLFNGLLLYEQILLILGISLFVLLFGAFVFMLIKGRNLVILAPFFLLSVAMIAFPSVTVIKIGTAEADINNISVTAIGPATVTAVATPGKPSLGPSTMTEPVTLKTLDQQAVSQLSAATSQVTSRPISDVDTYLTLARGYALLGKDDLANQYIKEYLKEKPSDPEVERLQQYIRLHNQVPAKRRAKSVKRIKRSALSGTPTPGTH